MPYDNVGAQAEVEKDDEARGKALGQVWNH